MKKFLIIGILLFLSVSLNAQRQFRKPLKTQNQGTNLAFSNYTVGVKLGCPWSYMPDSELSKVIYSGNFGYNLGIVAERYFSKLSIGLEGLFSQKGTKMYYDRPYQQSLTANGTFHREFYMGYNVATVRIPLTYYFKGAVKDDKVIPYLFVAPQVDIPLGFNATIKEKQFLFENPPTQTTITTFGGYEEKRIEKIDAKSLYNASALGGLGLMGRIPTNGYAIIVKFDVGFNFGLRNLAEEGFIWKWDEQEKKLVKKDNDRIIRSHDLEANLTILFPIKKRLRDACYYMD